MIPSVSVTSVVSKVSVAFRFLPLFVCVCACHTMHVEIRECVWELALSSSDSLPCPTSPTRLFCDFFIHFSDSFACHLALATKGRWERKCTLFTLKEPVSVSGSSSLGAFVTVVCFACHLCPSARLTSPCCPCYLGAPHGLAMLKDWAVRWTLLTDADGHLLDANCLLSHKLTLWSQSRLVFMRPNLSCN